jgi:hypothetical protein
MFVSSEGYDGERFEMVYERIREKVPGRISAHMN